jgi:hypothetical protein
LSCQPTATGSFSIEVTAGDSLGGSARASTGIAVNPLPKVTSLVPSSATILSGGSVQLTATVSGGTAPFHYAYEGLPLACSPADGALVRCSATPSGRYTVVVTVTDATGASANATASFTASAAPSPGPSMSRGNGYSILGGNEFWWGLAVGAAAIGVAGLLGWNRIRLARQGEQIVQELRHPSTDGFTTATGEPSNPASGPGREP